LNRPESIDPLLNIGYSDCKVSDDATQDKKACQAKYKDSRSKGGY